MYSISVLNSSAFLTTTASVTIERSYVTFNWNTYAVTQLHFKLNAAMPPTDRGKRGYSNRYISSL